MKAWCETCDKKQPAHFSKETDSETGEEYEDLMCDVCHFVIATVSEREDYDDIH